jgi:hypothetical protein
MITTDNGTGALAQVYNRAEQTRVWRLALWHARANARRLHMQGAQEDLARLLQIIAGAQEGTPPARLEPSAQAHESRGLHCIVMHPSRIGMQKGAPAIRRGSLDPRDCADTFRGQGMPQTRADYRADYAVSAHLRERAEEQKQEQAEEWTSAVERAERALFVWQRFILRLPAGGKAEQEQAEQAEQEQGKARKPAILVYLRGLRPLRKAQARALRAVLQAGGHGPASLEQEEARRYCAPCTCPASRSPRQPGSPCLGTSLPAGEFSPSPLAGEGLGRGGLPSPWHSSPSPPAPPPPRGRGGVLVRRATGWRRSC